MMRPKSDESQEMEVADYGTIEELLEGERDKSVHIECRRDATDRAVRFIHRTYANRRCAFYVETDKGFDRDTVHSYLRFFARIAGGTITAEEAIAHFGLKDVARTTVKNLSAEQRALMNFARMSLFEPEVVFCERPLVDISPRYAQSGPSMARTGGGIGRHRDYLRRTSARGAAYVRLRVL
jgi:ABC-2 type transport system ATP-binding protein